MIWMVPGSVQGVIGFARTEAPLRWGGVVSLWYLKQQFAKGQKTYLGISECQYQQVYHSVLKAG